MHEYEIRLLHADKSTDIVLVMMYLTDAAAIRAAKKIAEARPFEVWRDLDCIHGTSAKTNRPRPPSHYPAA